MMDFNNFLKLKLNELLIRNKRTLLQKPFMIFYYIRAMLFFCYHKPDES